MNSCSVASSVPWFLAQHFWLINFLFAQKCKKYSMFFTVRRCMKVEICQTFSTMQDRHFTAMNALKNTEIVIQILHTNKEPLPDSATTTLTMIRSCQTEISPLMNLLNRLKISYGFAYEIAYCHLGLKTSQYVEQVNDTCMASSLAKMFLFS